MGGRARGFLRAVKGDAKFGSEKQEARLQVCKGDKWTAPRTEEKVAGRRLID